MTDRLETAIRKGKRAAMMLDDPLLTEVLDKLETFATDAMLSCISEELIERRADVRAIRMLRQALQAYVDGGKIAQRTLDTPAN